MPNRTITHDTGGTQAGTLACLEAIRKAIDQRGECTEPEARGMAMSLYPPQVLVRVGAQKLKNRKHGTSCRFAEDVDSYMSGGAVSADAVEWFRIVGGNRQLTRLKQYVKSGLAADIQYDEQTKRFLSGVSERDVELCRQASIAAKDSLSVETLRSMQRRVYDFIRDQGENGATDEECQRGLEMNPSSQRPRRGELADAGLIVASGIRLTSSRRKATVWRVAT
ncbi:MAG: hypothetical protein EBQ89_06780 [Alphaproteobacteria bacterium]|jgi:hypothetical protein|nr:hypothetical protein [Alphaproteobacteria bacterium]